MGGCTSQDNSAKVRGGQARKQRAENEAIAASTAGRVNIKIVSPLPGCTLQITDLQQTVLTFLEHAAPHLGLEKSDARSLQLRFGNVTLPHELGLKDGGLQDGAQCIVLGVEEKLRKKKLEAPLNTTASKQAGGADSLSVGAFDPQVVRMLSRQLQPSLSPSEPSEAAQELADNLDRIIQMALGEMSDGIQQLECELCAAAAHKLKGLFGQLYLKEPYDVAGEISQMIRKGTDGDAVVVASVKHLRELFDLVVKGEMIPDRTRFHTRTA